MSLIIKDMKLPQHAAVNGDKDTVYRCAILVHADNSVDLIVDAAFASAYDNGHNIQRYPITETPTPHGRLIDADQLQTDIHGLLCENCVTFSCEKGIGCLIEDVFNLIDEAPTVIEEEHESEARKYVEIGKAISKGLQEGIEAINSEVP